MMPFSVKSFFMLLLLIDYYAAITASAFHVPGVPAVVQYHPGTPAAAGALFVLWSPTAPVPVPGAAVAYWSISIPVPELLTRPVKMLLLSIVEPVQAPTVRTAVVPEKRQLEKLVAVVRSISAAVDPADATTNPLIVPSTTASVWIAPPPDVPVMPFTLKRVIV